MDDLLLTCQKNLKNYAKKEKSLPDFTPAGQFL